MSSLHQFLGSRFWIRCTFAVLTLAGAVFVGCGGGGGDHPPTAEVKGTVKYKGQPLKAGTVSFTPQGQAGNPAMGSIGADGTYSLMTYEPGDGAVLGKHAVTVSVDAEQMGADPGLPGAAPPPSFKSPIPAKYSDASKSGLSFEVKEGPNVADFNLD